VHEAEQGEESSAEEVVAPAKHKRHSKTSVASAGKKAKGRASKTVPLKIVETNKRNLSDDGKGFIFLWCILEHCLID
jgi:hypothetical protein